MRRVAEIIHIVDAEREEFINGALNPDEDTLKVLWMCGVRKQQYFAFNEYLVMTFEYEGVDFKNDMAKMAAYLDSKGLLVKTRRKDIPITARSTTNWWAPMKRIGTLLTDKPDFNHDKNNFEYSAMLEGAVFDSGTFSNTSYDEDDWSEVSF